MNNEQLTMNNERRKKTTEEHTPKYAQLSPSSSVVKFFSFIFICITLISCVSGGGSGSTGNAARRHLRDTPVVVKAAFDKLDPVFRSNLNANAAIAVFPISTSYNLEDAEELYEQLQINIQNSGRYDLVEKRHVDQLLNEHDFQRSGLVSDASAISFGRLLGADAVILGSVTGRGNNRDLSLIAVDMEKRATLATAVEPWPQVSTRDGSGQAMPANMGMGNVLFLPILGGTVEENTTLANLINRLRDINDACNFIDESKNTAILPANFTGFTPEDNALLFQIGVRYKANFIIHSSIQKYGERNLAIISRYNVFSKQTDSVYYLDYLDPVEAWVKLPGVISTIMKIGGGKREGEPHWTDRFASSSSADNYLWVRYRDGVDRVFAKRMIGIFLTDLTEATGGAVRDISDDFEEWIDRRQGVERNGIDMYGRPGKLIPFMDWRTYMNSYFDRLRAGGKIGYVYSGMDDGVMSLFNDAGLARQESVKLIIIEASRQGNRTRFQLLGAEFAYTLDFTDVRDFIRQVRGMSLSINSKRATAGYDLGIVQGVKYNYWKYAEEDSTIADILSYTRPHPEKADISISTRDSTSVTFRSGVAADDLYYYSTVNNFSNATPIDPIKVFYNEVTGAAEGMTVWHKIAGLQPDTRYFIWVTKCWGNLIWLQGEPVMYETRTRP
ncbi:MAG: penicillin-binding protein activator LpoB [Treponema sp.]|jgi:hypothetical protein|nr:penicillin-binding protein activator LpoB [Treponema sp.]